MSELRARRVMADYVGLLVVLALLLALFGAFSEHFLTHVTLVTLANQIPALAVIAIGMTFVLVIGGIDLSVGSVLALGSALLGSALTAWGWPLIAAVPLALGVGLLAGAANGLVSVGWGIPSFIVTLGMLEIARGGAYLVTPTTLTVLRTDGTKTEYHITSMDIQGANIVVNWRGKNGKTTFSKFEKDRMEQLPARFDDGSKSKGRAFHRC